MTQVEIVDSYHKCVELADKSDLEINLVKGEWVVSVKDATKVQKVVKYTCNDVATMWVYLTGYLHGKGRA